MPQLLVNAEIRTMNPAMPRAEAVVIEAGRFAFVGTETAARRWLGLSDCDTIDAKGRTVIPGLNDAHMHFLHTAMRDRNVALDGACSVEEAVALLREGLARRDGGWLVGEGWNQERFAERRLLTRQDLDRVSLDVPVIASRACGHILAANSRALALAGVDFADGILREDECGLVWGCVPSPGIPEQIDAMAAAQEGLYAKGITSIQSNDFASSETALGEAIKEAGDAGRLRMRYAAQVSGGSLEELRRFFEMDLHRVRGDRFRVACVKLFADGSLGARTAWLREPYMDAPKTRGVAMYTQAEMDAYVRLAAQNQVPVAVHAIGDAAMQQALDAFAAEGRGLRHAVVHAQISDAAQLARCGGMGLLILAQPIFLDADAPIVRARVGEALAETSYRWRSMLSGGARVAFSTDCPVEPFDPMPNLYCAVTRKGLRGGEAYLPQEAFTLDEALYAYTAAGAYASGEEAEKGMIAPGMLADFVVLDRILDEKEPASLLETGVWQTYIGGECVYSA